jgi:hypothetical protein
LVRSRFDHTRVGVGKNNIVNFHHLVLKLQEDDDRVDLLDRQARR